MFEGRNWSKVLHGIRLECHQYTTRTPPEHHQNTAQCSACSKRHSHALSSHFTTTRVVSLCRTMPWSRFPRHPHICINRSTEGGKTTTPQQCSLRTRVSSQYSSCYTPRGDAVRQIRLRAQSFYAAFCSGVDGANESEIFRRRIRPRAHVLEATSELFADRQIGDCLTLRRQGRVVGHLEGWSGRAAASNPGFTSMVETSHGSEKDALAQRAMIGAGHVHWT